MSWYRLIPHSTDCTIQQFNLVFRRQWSLADVNLAVRFHATENVQSLLFCRKAVDVYVHGGVRPCKLQKAVNVHSDDDEMRVAVLYARHVAHFLHDGHSVVVGRPVELPQFVFAHFALPFSSFSISFSIS